MKTDKELLAYLDSWEFMEEEQRLAQLKFLLKNERQGYIKVKDVEDVLKSPIEKGIWEQGVNYYRKLWMGKIRRIQSLAEKGGQ